LKGEKMHEKAKKWDEEHPNQPPINRPCDWCGEIVERGLIHESCLKKEQELYLDIFYG
jgi:CRISPR/Cas system-associated protein Cas10 (large subunit of type III CRISPR-Cas system)